MPASGCSAIQLTLTGVYGNEQSLMYQPGVHFRRAACFRGKTNGLSAVERGSAVESGSSNKSHGFMHS